MPLPRTRLTLVFADETEETLETKLYRCTADEIAFERHYGFTYASTLPYGAYSALQAIGGQVADLDPESRKQLAAQSDEHVVFFAWRCWARAHSDPTPFDAFLETLGNLDVDFAVADAVDPTTVPVPSGG